jgi:lipoate-protein ligase A
MKLHVLPVRTGGAAENMATDFLLLQRYPAAATPRFRHYEWRGPAFTFGYAQKVGLVRDQLAAISTGERFDLCRRPTGGGIVDHRSDWTYSLVIPRGHPLEELRATQSYREVHEALAAALRAQGVDCVAKATREEPGSSAKESVCFERAEIYDVVDARNGTKMAGGAQKRNKQGLLFQGSVWKPAAGGDAVDWEKFGKDFTAALATALGATAERTPWPEISDEEVDGLTERYSSPEWLEFR